MIRFFHLKNWIKYFVGRVNFLHCVLDDLGLFSNVLKEAKTHVLREGGKVYFVYLPDFLRYSGSMGMLDLLLHKRIITNIVENNNIKVIDIHEEVFKKHLDPLSLFPSRSFGHHTPEGYRAIASTVVSVIQNHSIKPHLSN